MNNSKAKSGPFFESMAFIIAVYKKSNLLECIFINKKSLEISLNLTSQIKNLSLKHFFIVMEPNLEARSFYSEYRGILSIVSVALNNAISRQFR